MNTTWDEIGRKKFEKVTSPTFIKTHFLKTKPNVFLPQTVLVRVSGGSSFHPRSPNVRFPNSSRVTESPLFLGHVERGITDETGARWDLTVSRVWVGVPHPAVTWTEREEARHALLESVSHVHGKYMFIYRFLYTNGEILACFYQVKNIKIVK